MRLKERELALQERKLALEEKQMDEIAKQNKLQMDMLREQMRKMQEWNK